MEGANNNLSDKQAKKAYIFIAFIVVIALIIFINMSSKDKNSKKSNEESNSNIVSNETSNVETSNDSTKSNLVTSNVKSNDNKPVSVKSVKINGSKSVYVGKKITLNAEITPKDATNKNVEWKSSDTKIATVSDTGVVTGVKDGKVKIIVVTEDGKKEDEITLNVTTKKVEIQKMYLDTMNTVVPLEVGKTFDIIPFLEYEPKNADLSGLKFESSNPNVATISDKGIMKGVSKGSATIMITAPNGKKASMKVKVVDTEPTSYLYVHSVEEEFEINSIIIKLSNVSNSACTMNNNCSGKISAIAKYGTGSNLTTKAINTSMSPIDIPNTKSKFALVIVDGKLALAIWE